MKAERLLAVGDIHGCLKHLESLMERVAPTVQDQIVFLGDYIDRGPDGKGVIDYLLAFRQEFPATIFLKGNHEEMFRNYLDGRDEMLFLTNGGQTTLDSYDDWEPPAAHLDFIEGLRLYHETDDFIFVHAGLRPGLPPEGQRPADLLWIRDEFIRSSYDWGKIVVFGHTPLARPLLEKNKIGLDTGATYGRTLTCCEVRQRRCWSFP